MVLKSQKIFDQMKFEPQHINQVGGVLQFKVLDGNRSKPEIWTIDLKDKGTVTKGETQFPDTIIEGQDEDISFIFNNKWELKTAFLRNKIKVDGDNIYLLRFKPSMYQLKPKL